MGLEPTTPCLQSRCSSQLSYSPSDHGVAHGPALVIGSDQRSGGAEPAGPALR